MSQIRAIKFIEEGNNRGQKHFLSKFLARKGPELRALSEVRQPNRWQEGLLPTPPARQDGYILKRVLFSSQYTSLSRILDMNYTKASKVTEILVKNLTVDVQLQGFNLELLRRKKIPQRRMKTRPSPEQKLGIGPKVPEVPREQLETNFECI